MSFHRGGTERDMYLNLTEHPQHQNKTGWSMEEGTGYVFERALPS